MKILVTGSSGFIGTNLVKYLKDKGYSVKTADIQKGKDLRDMSVCLKATEGIDCVIHLAADNGGYFYLKDNDNCAENNYAIDSNIIDSCIKNNVNHLIYASSSCVYPIDNPENLYGLFKLKIEDEIKETNLNYSIARFQNIYGKHETIGGIKEKVIPAFIRQINEGKVSVYGDGTQERSFVYVDDLCEIILNMIKDKTKFMDVGGKVTTLKDLLNKLIIISGKEVEVEYGTPVKDRTNHFPKDISKTSLIKGLKETYKWQTNK